MTNAEIYLTPQDRVDAFADFCDKKENCCKAAVNQCYDCIKCAFDWLEHEDSEVDELTYKYYIKGNWKERGIPYHTWLESMLFHATRRAIKFEDAFNELKKEQDNDKR